ncbi:MAG: hypothetical protein K9J13_00150 [Saprospiraceae bacterium]|nr:hypothetical protein [Saprospiraceae bacterium]
MKTHYIIIWAFFLPTFLFGQTAKVSISNILQDSLRVSVYDIIKDPIIRISGSQENRIISYRLTLNINGVVHILNMKSDSLEDEKIQLLKEVRNDKPRCNTLNIEQVKYRNPDNTIENAKGLYLWLAKESDCNNKYYIKEKRYKNKWQIQFEYFYCNDTCFKVNHYSKSGILIETKEYFYTPDKIVITHSYRKGILYYTHYEMKLNEKDDGVYYIYYPSGSIRFESKNVNGVRVLEKMYNEDGKLVVETNCDITGSKCTVKSFDINGNINKEKRFKYKRIKYKF